MCWDLDALVVVVISKKRVRSKVAIGVVGTIVDGEEPVLYIASDE